ncbi:HAAS signaling domain-containing protein [Halobacillus salinus]|uniref:DUF1700 domain-containing protein n=1 Tax=Halobacillus salinus TaxID=192814 RepID=A0A4Z0GWY7_9BACI|nr:hypothetical protein [Halobacillus salinus]TGB01893.1 hypothetical protein E4663_14760 [Halobacillus salinus]
MSPETQRRYLEALSQALSFHPDRSSIIEEYKGHLQALEHEEVPLTYEALTERLGDPDEIAEMFKEEHSVTESRLHWLFVFCNVLLFVGGGLLTLAYHLFDWNVLQWLFTRLLSIPTVIIVLYFGFWTLLGYEIGKAFGPKGLALLKKTYLIGIVPNLILMVLTVFNIIPRRWFDPLITTEFIIVCIVCTGLLYPVSLLACRWGRRMSL